MKSPKYPERCTAIISYYFRRTIMSEKRVFSILVVLMSGLMISGMAQAAGPSPVGWWKFDETSGTIASDSSGNEHHGTLVGSPQWGAGYFGGALEFAGDPDMVAVPYSAQLNPADQFTVMLWANVAPGGTGYRAPFSSRVPGYNLYAPAAGTASGTWEMWVGLSPGWAVVRPGPAIQEGEWIHIAGVYDNGDIKLYGDGQLGGETTGVAIVPNREGELRIGAGGPATGPLHHFMGKIDDVRVYDVALSVEEILLAMEGSGEKYPYALNPNPANGTLLEATWANLTWRAGDSAVSHNVYLSDNFDDVNDGVANSFQGSQTGASLVVGFPGFPIPGGLIPGTTYYWRIDEVNDADPNSPWKGGVWSFTVPPKKAYDPSLPDGATNVFQNVALSWTAGYGAKLHSVYFGDNLDEVSNAEGAPSQPETTYMPEQLELEKTYYWRVDEYDGVVIYKGDVWSFTTVPDIAVADPNLSLWWPLDEGRGATAVDRSGHGYHGMIVEGAQWKDGYQGTSLKLGGDIYVETDEYQGVTGAAARTCCAWIKTATAGTRDLMSWGQNAAGQKWRMYLPGSGALRIEINGGHHLGTTNLRDGMWHHVAVTFEDDGSPDVVDTLLYVDGRLDATSSTAEEPIDTAAGPVRIGESRWHNAPYMDEIDDVRIYDKALTAEEIQQVMLGNTKLAGSPDPKRNAIVDVRKTASLSWSAGDAAVSHDVYFGGDRDAVAVATKETPEFKGNQAATSLSVADMIEFGGGDYYWRVDEVEADGTAPAGTIWKFTVPDYLIVDDFEAYDVNNNEIWWSWKDGLGYPARDGIPAYPGNGTGSMVGDETSPTYMEMSIVHGGAQSMPMWYVNNNPAGAKYSEVELTLPVGERDWTIEGIGELSLWFRGETTNAPEPLYVALAGAAVVYNDDPNATQAGSWTNWVIPLQDFAALGVNLANVDRIALGVGTRGNATIPGTMGKMYFDDILLSRPPEETAPQP